MSLVPGTASELSGLVGVSEPAQWFATFAESAIGKGNICLSPVVGDIARGQSAKLALQSGNKTISFASSHYTSASNATTGKTFADATSFLFAVYFSAVGLSDENDGCSIKALGGGYKLEIFPWRLQQHCLWYVFDPSLSKYAYSTNISLSGGLTVGVFGWDVRDGKGCSYYNGIVRKSDAISKTSTWTSAGALKLIGADVRGNLQVAAIGGWSGATAETLIDNLATVYTALSNGINKDVRDHTVSSSIVVVPGRYVTRANEFARSANGLLIHPSVTNLISHSYSDAVWTASELTKKGFYTISGTGIRTLTQLTETATSSEHKNSITFTPLTIGNHVVHFEAKFGNGCEQIGIEIDNGTDQFAMSLDMTGAQTPFATGTGVTITTLAYRHYSVSWIVDLTVTDVCTLLARGLEVGTYNDDYLGSTSKSFHIGNWCVTSGAAPSVHPVSLGSAATAIAPIVDWTLASALRRLAGGRMTCDFTAHFGAWPEADVPLWTWRQNATNGVEVWLIYRSTTDHRRLFVPAIKAIVAGSSVTTELSYGKSWVLQNDASGELVETLRASISIGSSGVAAWWFRADAGLAIYGYEEAPNLSGIDQVASYTAPVPTSLRLGSSLGGTGQQDMTIKEVAVW